MWTISLAAGRVAPTPSATFEVFARYTTAKLRKTVAASAKTMAKRTSVDVISMVGQLIRRIGGIEHTKANGMSKSLVIKKLKISQG